MPFALLALLGPATLLLVSAVAAGEAHPRPRRTLLAARLATGLTLALAVAAAVAVATRGAAVSPTLGIGEWGLGVRLDALSVTLFLLIAFVGTVVADFSRRYLDGDPRQAAFAARLCMTLAAVITLVLAANLLTLVLAWIATSLALHTLLVFRPERRGAVVAARKKFIAARIGDAALVGAAVLLFAAFGTADIGAILDAAAAARAAGEVPGLAVGAAALIAVAAILKSAQFPLHGWLPEVMETPTPVSALLHAGIINAGGFLVVRFADVMLLSPGALHTLAIVGGFTALFGAVVMLTQPAVKTQLAWSTVAQMGFMLLQCGLGSFALAVLHLVAHSLYKAHAFLSSGSAVDVARAVPGRVLPPVSALHIALGLPLALGLYVAVAAGASLVLGSSPAVIALGAIMVLGLTHFLIQGVRGGPGVFLRVAGAALGVSLLYVTAQAAAAWLLADAVPATPPAGPVDLAIMALAVASFAAVSVGQLVAPRLAGARVAQAAYVHLQNGLYLNALLNRLVGAFRQPSNA
jgi:NAD(P)H-quinone oxidoreductase subunit 5